MPVGVGFGIRDAASAVAVAQVADAVVIGSRLIQEMEATPRERAVAAVEALVREIRRRSTAWLSGRPHEADGSLRHEYAGLGPEDS